MSTFGKEEHGPVTGHGFERYRAVLEERWSQWFLVGLLTLLGLAPFGFGLLLAITSESVLVLFGACVIGGLFAGPALYGLYDAVFRGLRDAPGRWTDQYKQALAKNWKEALVPGIFFCLLVGAYLFMGMLFLWAVVPPTPGTLFLYGVSLCFFTMLFAVYWPLLVLFDQPGIVRLRNAILFCIRYFPRVLGVALLELLFWGFLILFMPWTGIFLFVLWFVVYAASFLLYDKIDEAFQLEAQIARCFPEQTPFYETDEEWIARRQAEDRQRLHDRNP